MLVKHDGTNEIIQAGTPGSSDQVYNEIGLANNHAFTVLGAQELDGQKMVKMRNPWGAETFHGSFSDSDARWTEELLEAASHTVANDGIFWITIEDYHNSFLQTWVN